MRKFTDEEIKKEIKTYYDEHGDYPSVPFNTGKGGIPFSYSLIRERFGGIRNLLEEIDIPPKHNLVGKVSIDCNYCGKKFSRLHSELSDTNYCSKQCWAESLKGKKEGSNGICPDCGGDKTYYASRCRSCYNKRRKKNSIANVGRKTLGDLTLDSASRAKYNPVRHWARMTLERVSDREYECQVCGFNIAVDVCHIKPISEFGPDDLIKEINSLDNLVYLCPNHHTMLDAGLITIEVSDL